MATLCCLDDTYNIDMLQAHYGTTGEYIMATLIQDAILYGTEKPASLQRVIRRKQRKQKVKFRLGDPECPLPFANLELPGRRKRHGLKKATIG